MKKQASASKPAKQKVKAAPNPDTTVDGIVGEGAELHLQLPGFEGPFDLLLHLIEEHELDILDIPVAFVTERYLQYLALMQELNIDVASDYLVMAATLAHLKSRLLLPTPPADDADTEEVEQDPRAELIRRLLEYQKYKQAAEQLANRSVLGRDTFVRGALPEIVEGPAPLAPVGVFKLLEAFQKILARAKTVVDHQIEFERLSITERINQLVDRLRQLGPLSFDALFDGQRTRAELIVTFLALLEMTRLRLTNVHQEHVLAPIMIELAVTDGEQAIDSEAADYLTADATPRRGASPEDLAAAGESTPESAPHEGSSQQIDAIDEGPNEGASETVVDSPFGDEAAEPEAVRSSESVEEDVPVSESVGQPEVPLDGPASGTEENFERRSERETVSSEHSSEHEAVRTSPSETQKGSE